MRLLAVSCPGAAGVTGGTAGGGESSDDAAMAEDEWFVQAPDEVEMTNA